MAITYTTNAKLRDVPFDTLDWDDPMNENTRILDAVPAVGWMKVTTAEVPSASLNVSVAAGAYAKLDGSRGTYAGVASTAVTDNATTCVYLDSAGAIQKAGSYPTTAIIRLATVTALSGKVTSITDDRIPFFVPHVQLAGANQAALTDSTGGTASTTLAAITAGAGYTQADMVAAKNAIASLARLTNQIRSDLVALGLLKGSA
jgi:hypothetical protein